MRHRGWSWLIFTRSTHATTPDGLSVRKEGCTRAELRPCSRPQRWSFFKAVKCARRALKWRVAQALQVCAASPTRAARVLASVALTFARPPAAPKPKASFEVPHYYPFETTATPSLGQTSRGRVQHLAAERGYKLEQTACEEL